MADAPGAPGNTGEEEFEVQARAAGLALPAPKHTNPWLAASIVLAIVVASVGVGTATGWIDPKPHTSLPPFLAAPEACQPQAGQTVRLNGSIATGSDPLLNASMGLLTARFASAYAGCLAINYSTAGGASGLGELGSRAVGFALGGAAPSAAELGALPSPAYLLPSGLTGVAVVYHVAGVPAGLNLSANALEGIYAGRITSWGDPAIARANPGVALPATLRISVLYRSDANPLNTALSQYLAGANASWSASAGTGADPAWPAGSGVNGSLAMSARVASTDGSIGYVEWGTPVSNGSESARLQNFAGDFVAANASTLAETAAEVANRTIAAGNNWSETMTGNESSAGSYPLLVLTYVTLYRDLGLAYGGALGIVSAWWMVTFLWWVVTDGGYVSASLGFPELPGSAVASAQSMLENVSYNGASLLEGAGEGSTDNGGGETGEF